MKNNNKSLKRILLVCLTTITICCIFVFIVDIFFNGSFLDWFYRRFIYEFKNTLSNGDVIEVTKLNWSPLKKAIILIAIFAPVTIILIGWGIVHFYTKYKIKNEITIISNYIRYFLENDTNLVSLPSQYAEIESQLAKIKTATLEKERLLQTESQQKNDLITYLAHDLKTPLASVIGYLSLLDEAYDMPLEQKAKYTGIALEKAYRLEQLINEFFEITRFNLHSIVLNKSRINLSLMLQQMADEFYPMLAPQNKEAVVCVPEELYIFGDADKLARVFNNIFKNAIAYSYENSKIDITAIESPDTAIITFSNTGDPIPQMKLDTIFEKFYRLDTSRSSKTGGSGLGLAIAKEIITAHQGTISVTSDEEKTVFRVEVPLKAIAQI